LQFASTPSRGSDEQIFVLGNNVCVEVSYVKGFCTQFVCNRFSDALAGSC
jgi:hypothetical protein